MSGILFLWIISADRRKESENDRSYGSKEKGAENIMGLSLQMKRNQNILVVRLCGELDHHAAEKVRTSIEDELDRRECTHLILNLAELDFMDSSGLGVILGRYKRVSQLGGKMFLCSIRPSVYRLMAMSGLFKILPTYDDEESAINACGVAS